MQFLELRIPPLIQVAVVALVMWALPSTFPQLSISIPGANLFAAVFSGVGVVFLFLGGLEFRMAKTTVDPRVPHDTARLVATGIYRFSRNPMYTGCLAVLIGWSLYLSHVLPFFLLPVFVAYLSRFQIVPEERFMKEKFNDEYRAYTARVRRWI